MTQHWGGKFGVPARCLNRKPGAVPMSTYAPGTFAAMYELKVDPRVAYDYARRGWVAVKLSEVNDFFRAKDWCDSQSGLLGQDWFNGSLEVFFFKDPAKALLFKLTYG